MPLMIIVDEGAVFGTSISGPAHKAPVTAGSREGCMQP